MRILIAEDERRLAGAIARGLRREGMAVDITHDGASALAMVGEFHPDVVLLDIGLPKGDGVEIARRIRSGGALPGAMLIALSGYQASRRPGSDGAGFDAWLVKPIEGETLRRLIFKETHPK